MKLTKNQQAIILQKALDLGIYASLIEFQYKDYNEGYTFRHVTSISLKESDYVFEIESGYHINNYNMSMKVYCSPGESHTFHSERLYFNDYRKFDWEKLEGLVTRWLYLTKVELDAIGLISRWTYIPIIIESDNDWNNEEVLSKEDRDNFANKLEDLKESILHEIKLTKEHEDLVRQKLDELILKVDRLNKFDIKTQFYGLMTNLASSVLYDQAGKFWEIFISIFSNIALPRG